MAPTSFSKILLKNNNTNSNNIILNDNNNKVWNNNNKSNLIFIHGKKKSKILETICGTKYTTTTNQSNTSNQHFKTKPKLSKLLKNSDKSWGSTEISTATYKNLDKSWESTETSSEKWKTQIFETIHGIFKYRETSQNIASKEL